MIQLNKTTTLVAMVALMLLPLLLQTFGDHWVRIADSYMLFYLYSAPLRPTQCAILHCKRITTISYHHVSYLLHGCVCIAGMETPKTPAR